MKTIILCGGQGTRLKEETEFKPKPMVEIGGKPILWHIMKTYSHYGFKDFILALGFQGNVIRDYFLNYEFYNNDFTLKLGDHRNCQIHGNSDEAHWTITLAETGLNSMTGFRIKLLEKYIDQDDLFMVTYGDGVADISLVDLLAFHKQHGKIGTLTGVNPPSRWGELVIEQQAVRKFQEKGAVVGRPGYINGGFFIFKREFFNYLDNDPACILEKSPLEKLADAGELMVYQHPGFWQCMDTYRDYLLLNELWSRKNVPWARAWMPALK
ncbi:glucose-1-phosphate cytidylyltransferase [candidate division KSB1 bacterium]|nr:glucose-1-phosphate cytidylyltransferase [candidate division KSB1 bacterium]